MARRILIGAAVLGLCGAAWADDPLPCEYGGEIATQMVAATLTSPFFGWLVANRGAPLTCTAMPGDGQAEVRIGFAGGAELRLGAMPEIEVATAEVTPGDSAPPETEVLAELLAAQEIWMMGSEGCGIGAARLREALDTTRGPVEQFGAICNCRAFVTRQGAEVRGFGFSHAC